MNLATAALVSLVGATYFLSPVALAEASETANVTILQNSVDVIMGLNIAERNGKMPNDGICSLTVTKIMDYLVDYDIDIEFQPKHGPKYAIGFMILHEDKNRQDWYLDVSNNSLVYRVWDIKTPFVFDPQTFLFKEFIWTDSEAVLRCKLDI